MEYAKNKFIEDWGAARENMEKTFRFNRRSLGLFLLWGIAVPTLVYKSVTNDMSKMAEAQGKPPRKFL
ncbi:hypothetical protein CBR_g40455 [Chara braunii]|uniref:Uncharacterized protein n=1 Tax=Chara braunii TaxID=69332 RepID=A0A388LTS1_CHABU|nr:hypothetical protein CBR_g40455 [Chara braunii]|eukprot:GBG85728.1 hypothetical protein CBR_g40455 [Chara braunii]